MKTTLRLAALAALGGAVLFLSSPINSFPVKTGRCPVLFERVSREPAALPRVKEINFFETDKRVGYWIGRHSEYRGIIRKRSFRHATQGSCSMMMFWRLKHKGWITLLNFPSNWQGYRRFGFDVYNPMREPIRFEFRIGDYFDSLNFNPRKSRFVVVDTIRPGMNRFVYEFSDMMKYIRVDSPRKIMHLRLLDSERLCYFDNMRVER